MIEQISAFFGNNPILVLGLITLIPFFELRASIPYGIIVMKLNWWYVFAICVIANIVLVPIIWFFLHHVIQVFLKVSWIDKCYQKVVERSQRRVKPYIDKYGKIGLALFIGVPLPGSGVYSGGLGAYLLGFDFKDYLKASIIGVLIAGIAVTLISVFGNGAWMWLIKR